MLGSVLPVKQGSHVELAGILLRRGSGTLELRHEVVDERDDSQTKLGLSPRDMTVGIGAQHAAIVHLIMRSAVKPDVALPSEIEILEHLHKFRDDYIKLLEKAPDGRNPEAEARSLARKEALRQRWNKSR